MNNPQDKVAKRGQARSNWDDITDNLGHETIQGVVRQLDQDSRTGRIRTHGLPVPVMFDDCVDLSLIVKAFVSGSPVLLRGYWQRTNQLSNDGKTAEYSEMFMAYAATTN